MGETLPSCWPLSSRLRTASISWRISPWPPWVLVLSATSVPASTPDTHFMLTAISCNHGKPLSGSAVTSGSGWLIVTSFSPRILLLSPQQTHPHWNEAGLTAHRLSGSGMVFFCPNVQMPPSRLLNCMSGRSGRLPTDVVSTVLNAATSSASAAVASAFGAGVLTPPLSLAGLGLGSWSVSGLVICASLLEGFDRLGKRPHDLARSEHRSACVFAPHQGDPGAA